MVQVENKVVFGVQASVYAGDAIPMSEVHLGTVFFAEGVGFGVVHMHSAEGMIVKAMTASGSMAFLPDVEGGVYRGCVITSMKGDGTSIQVSCGPAVHQMALLGVLELPRSLSKSGGIVEGVADYTATEAKMYEYIDTYMSEYSGYAKTRKMFESAFTELRVSKGLTESERNFEPSKSEFLCLLREGETAAWYYRQRTGKFFKCTLENVSVDDTDRASEYRLLKAIKGDTSDTVRGMVVKAISDTQAEEALRTAVSQGRLSTYIYSKYFGPYADMKTQIAVRIPTELKKRMDWTGQTIESLLEKGCAAYLNEVQADFEEPLE